METSSEPNVIDKQFKISSSSETSTSTTSSTATRTTASITTAPTTSAFKTRIETSLTSTTFEEASETTASSKDYSTEQPDPYQYARQVKIDSKFFPELNFETTSTPETTIKPTTWNSYTTSRLTTDKPYISSQIPPDVSELTTAMSKHTTITTNSQKPLQLEVERSVSIDEIDSIPQHIALEAVETALSHFEPASIEKLKRFIDVFEQEIISVTNDKPKKLSPAERKLLRQAAKNDPTKRYCENLPPLRNGYVKFTYGLEEGSAALYYCNPGFAIKQRGYSRKCRCTQNSCYWNKSPRVCILDPDYRKRIEVPSQYLLTKDRN